MCLDILHIYTLMRRSRLQIFKISQVKAEHKPQAISLLNTEIPGERQTA